MVKETIICIVIIIMIFTLDIFTQNFTKNTVSDVTKIFSDLKGEILKNDKTQIDNGVKKLDEKWGSVHDKLAYYIEHDELEKVDTAIIEMKAYIETDDYSSAVAELDEGKFVLEHIQEKYAFNLKNVF